LKRRAGLSADTDSASATVRPASPVTALAFVALVLLLTVALAGCGGGIASPDLFVVQRTGSVAGANLTLLVGEAGAVRCNGKTAPMLSDPQVVLARGVQEELKEAAAKHLSLAARPGSVLSYYLRDEYGTVRFADNSAGRPKALSELQQLVLEVAQKNCHLPL
jgi:hypothetical protein